MIYRVWDPDDCDESGARRIEADTATEAARDFAERYDHDDWAEDTTRAYHVRAGDGTLYAVSVHMAIVPSFRAGLAQRIEEAP